MLRLLVHNRKEYRGIEAYLNNRTGFSMELTEQASRQIDDSEGMRKVGIETLANPNDAITASFRKSRKS